MNYLIETCGTEYPEINKKSMPVSPTKALENVNENGSMPMSKHGGEPILWVSAALPATHLTQRIGVDTVNGISESLLGGCDGGKMMEVEMGEGVKEKRGEEILYIYSGSRKTKVEGGHTCSKKWDMRMKKGKREPEKRKSEKREKKQPHNNLVKLTNFIRHAACEAQPSRRHREARRFPPSAFA